jgi:hypothetical protein
MLVVTERSGGSLVFMQRLKEVHVQRVGLLFGGFGLKVTYHGFVGEISMKSWMTLNILASMTGRNGKWQV